MLNIYVHSHLRVAFQVLDSQIMHWIFEFKLHGTWMITVLGLADMDIPVGDMVRASCQSTWFSDYVLEYSWQTFSLIRRSWHQLSVKWLFSLFYFQFFLFCTKSAQSYWSIKPPLSQLSFIIFKFYYFQTFHLSSQGVNFFSL